MTLIVKRDADQVGLRIRSVRLEQGMSQADLAAGVRLSASYLSLIESGRRPVTSAALESIATRLGCSVEFLSTGRGRDAGDAQELDLRFAEIALRNGDTEVAEDRFANVLRLAEERDSSEIVVEARWGLARTREVQGRLEDAIASYEALLSEGQWTAALGEVKVATALCRAYSECGDLSRAIDVGEATLSRLEMEGETDLSDAEPVELVSTLVGCYYERGDLARAHLLAQTALDRAEQGALPLARAAALWNAGLVAEARGDGRTARRCVDRALAFYSEGDNLRAVALLKVASAWLTLREPEPSLAVADQLLRSALADLPNVGSQVDMAYGETELARCRLMEGDWQAAMSLAEASLTRLGESPRLETARARLIVGHAKLDCGDVTGAHQAYALAASELRHAGARRQAASAWRELAESLARLGLADEALDAYREAADAAGVSKAPAAKAGSHAAARRS